jgi:hypothetical protein
MPIDRQEVVRLILQGLNDIGYQWVHATKSSPLMSSQSARVLETESGYTLATPAVADFQRAILGGRWSEGIALLPDLGIDMSIPAPIDIKVEEPASSDSSIHEPSNNPSKAPTNTAEQVKFLVSKQKYLEYLELGQQKKALNTLRTELAPVAKNQEVLHTLSG